MTNSIDRRDFLRVSCAGAGLVAAIQLGGLTTFTHAAQRVPEAKSGQVWAPNAWIKIAPNNVVTFILGKVEMGQGTWTGLAMVMGDELDVEWKNIRVEAAPAADPYKDPVSGLQITGGSTGIRNMIEAMSKASAAVREMLVLAAAQEWKVPVSECQTSKGTVIHSASGRKMTYGELASSAAKMAVPAEPKLKPHDRLSFVGKQMPRLDSADKINGKGVFGIDVCIPGMLYSTLERPSAYGATLVSFDTERALKVPGVKQVVQTKDGVAVIATDVESAWKGRAALDAKWSAGSMPDLENETLDRMFYDNMKTKGLIAKNIGDVENSLNRSTKKIQAEYYLPFVAHAAMEPQNCVVHVRADSCEIWIPTQFQTSVLNTAMKETGLPAEKINVHTTMLGGAFGGKFEVQVVAEALRISKASGQIVKHIWTRAEDFQNDCFRPGSLHKIEGGLDNDGNLGAWRHKIVTPPIMERLLPALVKDGIDPSALDCIWNMSYSIPNLQAEYVRLEVPIPAGFWRSVGNSSNTFAVESFIDEMAHLARQDPLEFRLKMLKNEPRCARVLQHAADAAGWGKSLPEGMGRGIAQRFCYGGYCAQLAEVSVDRNTGVIKIHRMVTALDSGRIVNPDSVKAQIEGGTIMGISVALKERVSFGKGGVVTNNFSGYPILSMSETPRIEAHIISKDLKAGGVGEPPVPPVAPAIGNAVFNAIGVRLRKLPMTPENVLAAIRDSK